MSITRGCAENITWLDFECAAPLVYFASVGPPGKCSKACIEYIVLHSSPLEEDPFRSGWCFFSLGAANGRNAERQRGQAKRGLCS